MSRKFFHVFLIQLIFLSIISCQLYGDEYYPSRFLDNPIFNIRLKTLIKSVTNQIKNDGLNQEDEFAFAYLIFAIVQKLKAFKTPPVYWYSRKG